MNYDITHFTLKMPICKWISNDLFNEALEILKKEGQDAWITFLYGC